MTLDWVISRANLKSYFKFFPLELYHKNNNKWDMYEREDYLIDLLNFGARTVMISQLQGYRIIFRFLDLGMSPPR